MYVFICVVLNRLSWCYGPWASYWIFFNVLFFLLLLRNEEDEWNSNSSISSAPAAAAAAAFSAWGWDGVVSIRRCLDATFCAGRLTTPPPPPVLPAAGDLARSSTCLSSEGRSWWRSTWWNGCTWRSHRRRCGGRRISPTLRRTVADHSLSGLDSHLQGDAHAHIQGGPKRKPLYRNINNC